MPKDLPNADFTIKVIQGEPVKVPSADMLIDAQFTKAGGDLVIEHNGQTITVEGYFNSLETPDLVNDSGVRLSPEMIDSFVKSDHAGEYAQGGNLTMNDASPVGQITDITGDVMVTRADGTEVIAEVGTMIQQGDVIETSANGAANITFTDNTSFAVSEDARLSVDEFKYDSGAQEGSSFFSMLKGAFVYTSGMIGKDDPGNVSIETPTGSIGIRGTVIMGKIDPSGENSEFTILDGAVVITNAAGTVELNDMYETARLDGYNSAPRNLGQMTPDYVQARFKPFGSVAKKLFSRTFGRNISQDGDNAVDGDVNTQDDPNKNQDTRAQDSDSSGQDATSTPSDTSLDVPAGEKSGEFLKNPETIQTVLEQKPIAPIVKYILGRIKNFIDHLRDKIAEARKTPPTNDDVQDPVDDTNQPQDVFKFKLVNVGDLRAREFDDQGHIVGRIETFGNKALGVTYELDWPGIGPNPFSINPNTGVITVTNSAGLDFSDTGPMPPVKITARNADGTEIVEFFRVTVDVLLGDVNAARIKGSATVDTLEPSDNTDQIVFADGGNDTINDAKLGNNVLMGGSGDDTVNISNVGGGNKQVFGGIGNDQINDNGSGNNILLGEAGNDTIHIQSAATGTKTAHGGDGNDTFTDDSNALTTMHGGMGDDDFTVNTGGNKKLFGGAGDDVMEDNGTGNSEFHGGAGNDTIHIHNTLGNEKIYGNDGRDMIELFQADYSDTIDGGSGYDTLKLHNNDPGSLVLDYRIANASGLNQIEEIFLQNSTSFDNIFLTLDSAAINQITGNKNILIVNGAPVLGGGFNTVQLEGDWEKLTAFNGSFKDVDGNLKTDSAVYRKVGTDKYVITHNDSDINFKEGGGPYVTINQNSDPASLPELQPFL